MQSLIILAVLGLVGCGGASMPPVPNSADDFVKNDNGVGTARVFGIDFRVSSVSSGASNYGELDLNFVDPKSSSGKSRFTLGDDITVQLDTIDESAVRFVNGEDMGTLKVRDEVLTDDERKVTVNGNRRLPTSSDESPS